MMFRSWGATSEERAGAYPCDAHVEQADLVLYRAVDVAAPPAVVFRWLCQLRVAPYSYDWIDNLGRRSPRRLTDGLDELAVGQRFMTIFRLVALDPGVSITLVSDTRPFGRLAVTYHVLRSVDPAGSRLFVKLACALPAGPCGWFQRAVLPAGDLVMMRKQLLTLKALAERDATSAVTPTTPRRS
jgi:hypothetical protein